MGHTVGLGRFGEDKKSSCVYRDSNPLRYSS
jgi:hypothetical protein